MLWSVSAIQDPEDLGGDSLIVMPIATMIKAQTSRCSW